MAAFEAFMPLSAKEGSKANLVAASGQSLGMYSALTAVGAISFENASTVTFNGELSQDDWAKLIAFRNPVAAKAVKGWVTATLGKDYKVQGITDHPSAYASLECLAA